jgi:membrane dipeptidase
MQITRRSLLAQMGLLVAASDALPSLSRGGTPTGTQTGTSIIAPTSTAANPSAPSKSTGWLHDALIWDNHTGFDPVPNYDLEHLEDWRKAGVNYLSIDVGYDVIDWTKTIKNLGAYITWLEQRPDRFVLVRRVDDVLEAKKTGRLAITFDLEGMNALNGDASLVALYYRLGVRQMLTAYNKNNLAGGGCHDKDTGLTPFGRDVIAEMNRVGMVVDCSHTGYRTTMDIMEAATHPVIFSHSNPKTLRAHGRNITDDQIRACAKTGGVIGVTGLGYFLPDRPSSTSAVADCVTYVRDLVGVDHVGLGLDYTPPDPKDTGDAPLAAFPDYWPPAEYAAPWPMKDVSPAVFAELATLLVERGWSRGDVRKVLGENFLRVARAVWK